MVKAWSVVHTWTSLICTAFVLMLCVTGLPLVFQDEILRWTAPAPAFEDVPPDRPPVGLDTLIETARGEWPGHLVTAVSFATDHPETFVGLAPSWAAYVADPDGQPYIGFDARTGAERERSGQAPPPSSGFIDLMYRLHLDMFLGMPGQYFMLAMGVCLVAALVSGVALYGPFTRRMAFGEIRAGAARTRWLDIHNVLGIVTLVWVGVVGLTGALNNLEAPLFERFLAVDVPAALADHADKPTPARLSSAADALGRARAALPDHDPIQIVYPGNPYGASGHYMVWFVGRSPLTRHMEAVALVDADSGQMAGVMHMPWYLKMIEVSRPLHFGDYGGLPLKVIWAVLDVMTITILASGLYLWLARPRSRASRRASRGVSRPPA